MYSFSAVCSFMLKPNSSIAIGNNSFTATFFWVRFIAQTANSGLLSVNLQSFDFVCLAVCFVVMVLWCEDRRKAVQK